MYGKRVVITGMSALTPIGNDLDSSWKNLLAGKSGIGPLTRFDCSQHLTQIAGQVNDFNIEDVLPAKQVKRLERFCTWAMVCSQRLLEDAAYVIEPGMEHRVGCILGCGLGGLQLWHTNTNRGD